MEIKRNIIIVEHVPEEIESLKELLSFNYNISFVKDTKEALTLLQAHLKVYSMVLVHMNEDEHEFLKAKKEDSSIHDIPVIAFTTLNSYPFTPGVVDAIRRPINNKEAVKVHLARIIDLHEKHKINPYVDNDALVTPAIRIYNLHKSYGKKKVLKGLNLEVYNGELFGFIGKNGIGKSTTIDCMIGVKKFDEGTIELEGYSIEEEPLIVKSLFGYVASEPTCYESMTGYEYLEFIASIYRISEAEFAKGVEYFTKRLVLSSDDLSKSISNYSHGMKQKLCLIASLLNNPDVWILDEPTVGLDIMAIEELKKMMREYANHGKCVFVTSHNIDIIAKICDRVAIVNDGKVVELIDLNRDPNKRLQLQRIFLKVFGVEQ